MSLEDFNVEIDKVLDDEKNKLFLPITFQNITVY